MRPPREDQHAWMTFKRAGQNFGTLDTQANTIIFDCGDRSLGDAGYLGKLVLAHVLELAKNPNRLSDAHGRSLLGGAKTFPPGLRVPYTLSDPTCNHGRAAA